MLQVRTFLRYPLDSGWQTLTTVLITRPLEQARELAEQLDSAAISSIVMPLYDFSARVPEIDITSVIAASSGRKLVVFTSPRAVQYGLKHISAAIRSELEYAVVGAATCHQLEQAGLVVDWMPAVGFTSEDLLKVAGLRLAGPDRNVPARGEQNQPKQSQNERGQNEQNRGRHGLGTKNPGKGTAIVIAAPGGRDVLPKGLESMGWAVQKAMVYQRQALLPTEQSSLAIINATNLISIWTSTSALTSAQKCLPAEVWARILAAPALVISERIKHHLHQMGASDITLTDGPGNADLLQSICRFASEHRSPKG